MVVVLLALLWSPSAAAGVLINELLPDPVGSDGSVKLEWVELYNPGPSTVDVSGWVLERYVSSSTPYGARFTLPVATSMAPDSYLVIGETNVTSADFNVTSLNLGNATTDVDAVRLLDASALVQDTVIYGSGNVDALLDDLGVTATSFAADPTAGSSLARTPNGTDSQQSGADFQVQPTPTPGAINDSVTGGTGGTGLIPTGGSGVTSTGDTAVGIATGALVINELLYNPTGADSGKEWVEIRNNDVVAIDLQGWTLERTKGFDAWATRFSFPHYVLAPGAFMVVGEASVSGADLTTTSPSTLDLGNGSGGDGMRLLDPTASVLDTVIYGGSNSDGHLDDLGNTAAPAPSVSEGSSIARLPDGSDTHDSSVDFVEFSNPTPGSINEIIVPTGDTGLPFVPATGELLINELLPAPAGADTGFEWVELYNPGAAAVDLAGWTIERATSGNFGVRYTFPSFSLAPGSYMVVGGESVVGADLNLDLTTLGQSFGFGNASSNGDAVRLVDATGLVSDTVIYGPNNDDGFLDDQGVLTSSVAPKPKDDQSLARNPDGVDTDDSGVDFALSPSPTPGALNPNTCGDGVAAGANITINEYISNPSGADSEGEWVELYNSGATDVDISGWQIASGTQGFTKSGTIPLGTVLPASSFLVVGVADTVLMADVVASGFDLGNATSNADGVQLQHCNGTPIDTVVYGDPANGNPDGFIDDTGAISSSFAPKSGEGISVARNADGVDTDLSAADFSLAIWATPGTSNTAPPETCGGPESGIKVNELLADVDGDDAGFEWIELYHGGNKAIQLEGWEVQRRTSSSWSTIYRWEEPTKLSPGSFVLIGDDQVPSTDIVPASNLSLGNGTSTSDAVRLTDCRNFPADTVVYGGPNTDGIEDDSGKPATSLATSPAPGASLARVRDGYDTDLSRWDFVLEQAPTPGAANPKREPISCTPSDGSVFLNELMPNPASTDAGYEWVELYNAGSSEVSIAGWGLSIDTDASNGEAYEKISVVLPGGATIAPGGFYLIGEELLLYDLDFLTTLGLGSGSHGDGLRLYDCADNAVDTVVYGEDDNADELDGDKLVDDNGKVVSQPVSETGGSIGEDKSIARLEDGADSDDMIDWLVERRPTPGRTNFHEAQQGADPIPAGCGCGSNDSGAPSDGGPKGGDASDAPTTTSSGCSTTPLPFGGLEVFVGVIAVLRRRRRR